MLLLLFLGTVAIVMLALIFQRLAKERVLYRKGMELTRRVEHREREFEKCGREVNETLTNIRGK